MSEPRSCHCRERYRALIHTLNERYREAWDRAQSLEAELADIRGSRLWRLFDTLRRIKLRLRRWVCRETSASAAHEPDPRARAGPVEVPVRARRSERLNGSLARASGWCHDSVSIIIPFRDRAELLQGCLRSLTRSANRRFEIVLVNNGSREPRTRRVLRRLRKRRGIRVIDCPDRFNFSRLCNAGARHAHGDYLLFLNNDVEVLTPDWLEQLLRIAADPQVGIAGATLLYPDQTIQHAGIFPRTDGTWHHVYRGRPADYAGDHGELRTPRSVPAVTAACLLIRRKLFLSVGAFDERFALTFGDVELCRRVTDRGLSVVVTPHARLLHYESLSRGYSTDHLVAPGLP
jgi:O-antigen biosynthesis protein